MNKALRNAVQQELARRNTRLLRGLHTYLCHSHERKTSPASVVWQKGGCRLLDYPAHGTEKATIFFIPSLINRHYILDLAPGRSLVAYLAAHGMRSLVMDWGNPSHAERGFNCGDYVMDRLLPALRYIQPQCVSPLIMNGYCMGGMLALAAAQKLGQGIAGLALFATPWDFHAQNFPRMHLAQEALEKFVHLLDTDTPVPGEIVQSFFYALNPWAFARKFSRFSTLLKGSKEMEEFIAIEAWANDTVDMASGVARECLIDWVQHNRPAQKNWQVGGETILPESFSIPTFLACPMHDTIVPPDAALPLACLMPHATLCYPASGHVSMVAGSGAEQALWKPFLVWMSRF